jgi:DNA-directed RNA polymerase specialized sigma24 family protein
MVLLRKLAFRIWKLFEPMNDAEQPTGSGAYPTTPWTLIIEVIQKGGDEASLEALGRLFESYRTAVQHFFQRRGRSETDAADLTLAFFQSRIVEPWNRRHGRLSLTYSEEDIDQASSLTTQLKERPRAVDEYLWSALSKPTQQALATYDGGKEQTRALRARLAADLNILVEGPSVYDEKRFSGVLLSAESQNLLGRKLDGYWTTWLNRSLLGDAFPRQLVKGIGFIYLVERKEGRRFRTFLCHALRCFLDDSRKGELAQKRGGKVPHCSIEELEQAGHEVGSNEHEEFGRDLDLSFALRVLDMALERFEHSTQLEAHLRGQISQKQAAEELGISEGAFKASFHRFRKRVAECFRLEVMRVVGPEESEIKAEIRYLMSLLAMAP